MRGPRPRPEVASSRCHEVPCAQLSATSATPEADVQVCRTEQDKIFKLENTLEVLSDSTGPAVDVLKSELEKARQAAKAPPFNVQISSTQDFIQRSERRLAELEAGRTAESKLFEKAIERLRQLEAARCAEEATASSASHPV